METWMQEVVSMMSGGGNNNAEEIKKEAYADNNSYVECSPTSNTEMYSPTTTTTTHMIQEFKLVKKCPSLSDTEVGELKSPESPERQYCSSTTQPHNDITIAMDDEQTKELDSPRRLCLVCGDIASGFHYGVASCEACKAFFKRTIQGNIEYTCPASGECEINKRRRKACQACRFRKCLVAGMMKEGVRLDRVRGGRQKYRRNPDSPYQLQVVATSRPMLGLEDIKMLDALATCEPDILDINASLENQTRHRSLSILSDLFDRELVGIIGWAKQIPGFTDLSLNDQMRLLQSTWAEILTLTLAYRSLGTGLGRLQFAADFSLDEKQSREFGGFELYQTCCHVVERLDAVSILKEEYFLLKALILSNSDVRLEHYQSLKKFRDGILTSLSDTISILRPSGSFQQFQQLLLCLPALRQADSVVRRFWSDVHQQDLVPMNKLFLEMLEAYCR